MGEWAIWSYLHTDIRMNQLVDINPMKYSVFIEKTTMWTKCKRNVSNFRKPFLLL